MIYLLQRLVLEDVRTSKPLCNMESILPILGVVFFLAYLANKLNKKDEESVNLHYDEVVAGMYNTQNDEEMKQEQEVVKPDTLGLMLNTLNQLGCQPTANEDGTISVQYQGENFHMEFGGMYARVTGSDVGWRKS